MFQHTRTFENEKLQLQDLNERLREYLSRVKQLEQENALLVKEINSVTHERAFEWENRYLTELRELRSVADQLAFEKSRAEVERAKLRREFQALQAQLYEETGTCRDVDGELNACRTQLEQAQVRNVSLEERLMQLQHEYRCLQDEHRQEISQLRNEVRCRAMPAVAHTAHAVPVVTVEEMERYALDLSGSWMETFEVYHRRVEELEESLRADKEKLDEIQREKMQYVSELEKLRAELEEQNKLQARLEDKLMHVQDQGRMELDHYQVIVEELEMERRFLANTIAEKLQEHQELMQVKMGLALEVAAYRALLEGEQRDTCLRTDRYLREAQKRPGSSTARQERRQIYPVNTGFEVKHVEKRSLRSFPMTTSFKSYDITRAAPVTASTRGFRSPASRRDMVSFTKASQVITTPATPGKTSQVSERKTKIVEERSVGAKGASQQSAKASHHHSELEKKYSPIPSPTSDQKEVKLKEIGKVVRVVSPPMMSVITKSEKEHEQDLRDSKACENVDTDKFRKEASVKISMKQGKTPEDEEEEKVIKITEGCRQGDFSDSLQIKDERDYMKADVETMKAPKDDKLAEMVRLEEIIEKVVKPAGLDMELSSSPDSKITYHVEKLEEEDGTARTQIVLESKVEEDLDVSDDSVLEELLSKGVKKVTLEDVKGTPTGKVIENLLSFGLTKGGSLENKSVNVEIIEEPLEAHSDEESEVNPNLAFFQPSSKFIQIEELENEPQPSEQFRSSDSSGTADQYKRGGYVHIHQDFKDTESPYFTQVQETEYFVSTPDDEPEEGGLSSYAHYGAVDDLSDEKYYKEGSAMDQRFQESASYQTMPKTTYVSKGPTLTEETYPECIIEEEIHVSPKVQESMLELLREDSKNPKQQLRGALEHLQGQVTGTLKEDLSLFTKDNQKDYDSLAVDIQEVQDDPDHKSVTIVAEVSVSQTLDTSGLLQEFGGDKSAGEEDFYLPAQRSEGAHGAEVTDREYSYVQVAGEQLGDMKKWEDYTTQHVEFGDSGWPQGSQEPRFTVHREERTVYYDNPDED